MCLLEGVSYLTKDERHVKKALLTWRHQSRDLKVAWEVGSASAKALRQAPVCLRRSMEFRVATTEQATK